MLIDRTHTHARRVTAECVPARFALAVSVLLLLVASNLPRTEADDQFEVDVTRDRFQSEFDKRKKDGLRLVDLTTTIANKKIATAWVWVKQGNLEWKASAGLTRTEIQKEVTAADTAGFRLTHLTAYVDGTTERYSAIWDKAEGPAMSIKYGVPHDKMAEVMRNLAADGFRPVRIAAVTSQRETRMTGVWEKSTDPTRELQIGLSDVRMKRELRTRQRQGFRIVQVCNYLSDGKVKLACIWEKSDGPQRILDVNVTRNAIERLRRQREQAGYSVVQISSCTLRSRVLYAAVWEKPAGQ